MPLQIFRHSTDPVVGENKPYFPRELTSFRGWQMSPKAFGRLADQLWQTGRPTFGRWAEAGSEYNSISRPVGKCSYKCSLVLLQLIRSSCYRLKSFSHPSTLGCSKLIFCWWSLKNLQIFLKGASLLVSTLQALRTQHDLDSAVLWFEVGSQLQVLKLPKNLALGNRAEMAEPLVHWIHISTVFWQKG